MAAQGAWVSIDEGNKAQCLVTTELDASRYALDHGLAVMFWPFGMPLDEAIAADKERRAKLVAKPATSSKTVRKADS